MIFTLYIISCSEHSLSLLEKLAEELQCSNQTTVITILPTPWCLHQAYGRKEKLSGRCWCGLVLTSKGLNCERVFKVYIPGHFDDS